MTRNPPDTTGRPIRCEVAPDSPAPNFDEQLHPPMALTVRGQPYPPEYESLDRDYALNKAAQLAEPFHSLALTEFRSLPFTELPPSLRRRPHERARAYYDSIQQLASRQEELNALAGALCRCSLIRRAAPHKQGPSATERHFAARHLPQFHPVSCPVLDVEQNAKEEPEQIEQLIESALWNATRSLSFDVLNVMHTLVRARIVGRIEWFRNNGCRFFYYRNEIMHVNRWPTLHVCEAVHAFPRHIIVGGVRCSKNARELMRAIPPWLKRYVVFVGGTKIKASSVTGDEVVDRHLPACHIFCLAIGSYVLTGWTEDQVPTFWR